MLQALPRRSNRDRRAQRRAPGKNQLSAARRAGPSGRSPPPSATPHQIRKGIRIVPPRFATFGRCRRLAVTRQRRAEEIRARRFPRLPLLLEQRCAFLRADAGSRRNRPCAHAQRAANFALLRPSSRGWGLRARPRRRRYQAADTGDRAAAGRECGSQSRHQGHLTPRSFKARGGVVLAAVDFTPAPN